MHIIEPKDVFYFESVYSRVFIYLEEKAQQYSFFICSLLPDTTLLILLFFFSPGRLYDMTLFFAYLAVLLLIKALVYSMMQINGREQAKQLNVKLAEYKSEERHLSGN